MPCRLRAPVFQLNRSVTVFPKFQMSYLIAGEGILLIIYFLKLIVEYWIVLLMTIDLNHGKNYNYNNI